MSRESYVLGHLLLLTGDFSKALGLQGRVRPVFYPQEGQLLRLKEDQTRGKKPTTIKWSLKPVFGPTLEATQVIP